MNLSRETHLILGTAGHIDHGKSSLIKALTGTDPDRLEEERVRGITIELGFAQMELSPTLSVGVVDVPGHERFVRQMIAGSTGIDIALLCIAADDGIMPQTIEHMAVLELLAIPRCVVALTKIDLVDDELLELVIDDVADFLATTPYADSPIVPLSSKTGAGLPALKEVLLTAAEATQHQRYGANARLPIDRVFTIKGHGTVITGTLWSGSISPDDELEILPQQLKARVRSVQIHGQQTQKADAGNRVALNLNALKKDEVHPGDLLATPHSILPSNRFDAWLSYLGMGQEGKPLKSGTQLRIAHGTREVTGRVLLMDAQPLLAPHQGTFAQIRLDTALPLSWNDRFIIRANSPLRVIGGGIVLNCHPRRRTNLIARERTYLDAVLRGDEQEICQVAFDMQEGPVSAQELAGLTGITTEQTESCLEALVRQKKALRITAGPKPPFYTTQRILQRCMAAIEKALLDFHTKNPQQPGVSRPVLEKLCKLKVSTEGFDALLTKAQELGNLVVVAGGISHPQAGSGVKRIEEDAGKRLFAALYSAGVTPPVLSELIAQCKLEQSLAYRALGILEKQGRIQRISRDLCFTQEALASIEAVVRDYLLAHGNATVAELRSAMGVSRKYAIPLLEYFDAHEITQREGDSRSLVRDIPPP